MAVLLGSQSAPLFRETLNNNVIPIHLGRWKSRGPWWKVAKLREDLRRSGPCTKGPHPPASQVSTNRRSGPKGALLWPSVEAPASSSRPLQKFQAPGLPLVSLTPIDCSLPPGSLICRMAALLEPHICICPLDPLFYHIPRGLSTC